MYILGANSYIYEVEEACSDIKYAADSIAAVHFKLGRYLNNYKVHGSS